MSPAAEIEYEVVDHALSSMGGEVRVAIATEASRRDAAAAAARRVTARIDSWAGRLTRFSDNSQLASLNAARGDAVRIQPTLAATLAWAADAERRSLGVVDVTMLDQRLAAEFGAPLPSVARGSAGRSWQLVGRGRGAIVEKSAGFRFDIDGVAKGWLADRAADLLTCWPGVAVDADGDIAVRVDAGVDWLVSVADPRSMEEPNPPLATLLLAGGDGWSRTYGVATSGTSVHRWRDAVGRTSHHLIDRRTGRPAETDVVQATVVAPSAREAEMIAKTAVILGSRAALQFLTRSSVHVAILLLEHDDVVATPGIERWLA